MHLSFNTRLLLLYVIGLAWYVFNAIVSATCLSPIIVCPIKRITHFPCPGCGLTRGIMAISKGNVLDAIFSYNALSVVFLPTAVIAGLWGLFDAVTGNDSLHQILLKTDRLLHHKIVLIVALAITVLNWAWNVSKGL